MKTIIYYLTGTGNSLEIAKRLSEELKDSELRSMPEAYKNGKLNLDAEVIGLVFPVYAFGIPLSFRRLLETADWGSVKHTFAVANFGGMPGAALYQVSELVKMRGGHLDAGYLIKMPDNYLPLYDVIKESAQQEQFRLMEKQIPVIAAEVSQRQAVGIHKSKQRFDRYITPLIYFGVYHFKDMDKKFWVTDSCNGCGMCALSCPFENIRMVDGKPQWQHKCEFCMRCINICPERAIQYKKGTLKKGRYINPSVKAAGLIRETQKISKE